MFDTFRLCVPVRDMRSRNSGEDVLAMLDRGCRLTGQNNGNGDWIVLIQKPPPRTTKVNGTTTE